MVSEDGADIQRNIYPVSGISRQEPDGSFIKDQNRYFDSITRVSVPQGDNPRSPSKILVEDQTGQTQEFPPDHILKQIGASGREVSISAASAYHIYDMHISGRVAGSRFPEGYTLGEIARLIESKFDFDEITRAQQEPKGAIGEHKYVGTKDVGIEFTTGVATMDQMVQRGTITQEQLSAYNQLRDRIREANRTDNQEEMTKIQETFNRLGYPIYLGQRFPGSPLLPFFDAQPIQTTEMAIVVKDGKLVTTMTGHHREPLPFSPDLEYIKTQEPDYYQQLLGIYGSDQAIQQALTADFEVSSADWLNTGFIQAREKPPV